MSTLELQPIDFRQACRLITLLHRHHRPPQGWKFGIAVARVEPEVEGALVRGTGVVGVITLGRPVARYLQDGWTLEATRCCTDGTKNAASMLYGAAWRAARAMGYRRLVTYTLASERGVSLRAAGYRVVHQTDPRSWDRPKRRRVDKHPTVAKLLWEAV